MCHICGLIVTSKKANLRRHILLHEPKVKRLKCASCGITCANKYNFKIHCERVHSELKKLKGIWTKENAKGIWFNIELNCWIDINIDIATHLVFYLIWIFFPELRSVYSVECAGIRELNFTQSDQADQKPKILNGQTLMKKNPPAQESLRSDQASVADPVGLPKKNEFRQQRVEGVQTKFDLRPSLQNINDVNRSGNSIEIFLMW